MILVLSHAEDDHTQGVLAELERRRHPVALVDSACFPTATVLSQCFSKNTVTVEYHTGARALNWGDCHAAWWRRPQPHKLDEALDPNAANFAYSESHESFAGALALLDAAWVNPPHLDERSHHKPLQLATAVRVGLRVPRTLITNDPVKARQFIDEVGLERTIYKTFLAMPENWRETRVLRRGELELLDAVRLAPVIFQEQVASAADLRVTVVGDKMFAAAIRSDQNGYKLDYRMNMDAAAFAPTELPSRLKILILKLMKRLGIVYGAVDFIQTPNGEYVFLEVNPAGEWLFVQERTAQPITAAMADLLIRLDGA